MISSDQISKYFSNPGSIQPADIEGLEKLIKTFPFCSSFYTLYLKGLANHSSVLFEGALRKASIHVHDRSHLYALINAQNVPALTEISEDVLSIVEEKQVLQVENIAVLPIENVPEKEESTIPIEVIEETPKLEIAPITSTVAEPLVIKQETDNLSLEALEPEINLAYFEVEMLLDQAPLEPVQHSTIESEKISDVAEMEIIDSPQISTETETEVEEDESNLSFVAWLKKKQAKKSHSEEIISSPISEIEPTIRSKEEINALLDKFIQDQPTISRPTQDFFNPVKNAKRSLEESEDLVTETLAEIYVLQKNFSKAITSYEKLILLYPEKKTFFASRIEKIREEIKKK